MTWMDWMDCVLAFLSRQNYLHLLSLSLSQHRVLLSLLTTTATSPPPPPPTPPIKPPTTTMTPPPISLCNRLFLTRFVSPCRFRSRKCRTASSPGTRRNRSSKPPTIPARHETPRRKALLIVAAVKAAVAVERQWWRWRRRRRQDTLLSTPRAEFASIERAEQRSHDGCCI